MSAGLLAVGLGLLASGAPDRTSARIDRRALVGRHDVTLTAYDGERPLQVGNGGFAFGMDATGLQTFAPFNTMSDWGWRSAPLPPGERVEDFSGDVLPTHGRPVRYPLPDPARPALSAWLAANPHRINLGRVGLLLCRKDGTPATERDLRNVRQHLDLWSGLVTSRFEIEETPVAVVTGAHPDRDAIAVHVVSPLVKEGRLSAFVAAPGDDPRSFANAVGDWNHPAPIEIRSNVRGRAELRHRVHDAAVTIRMAWAGGATLRPFPAERPSELRIVAATYGAGAKTVDVAANVAAAVREGRVALHVDNVRFGDPAPREGKTLRVDYVFDGTPGSVAIPENGDLVLGPPPTEGRVLLEPGQGSDSLAFVCEFAPKPPSRPLPNVEATLAASRRHWPTFWRSGGAIDLSGSRDPRWRELERRIVLSQYLMAVNEAGDFPPQESGYVNNGWYGRSHLEMIWWHSAHYALWNRWPLLNRSLGLYTRLLASSKARAKTQGYRGARWPKCIGPDGREWPDPIHALLVWQQPHPIFFAELDYRAHPTRATLERWRSIVEATADFLASYAYDDPATKRYVLGPPLFVVSENTDPLTTRNPAFELGYWRFGLRTAQKWRERLGLAPNSDWASVQRRLSPLPVQDGRYVLHEGVEEMWTRFNFEHPALIGTLGMLPGDGVDRATMGRTLDRVDAVWNFDRTWGWDFPMLAMCAARLERPGRAVDYLLHPSGGFQFDARGLATGGPFPYFPSNGGLLYAVAQMARGWDGAPNRPAPGFPADGSWVVRHEGLSPSP